MNNEWSDQQIITMKQDDYRVIYQYRAKRDALDLRNLEKQVSKALKAINGQIGHCCSYQRLE